MLGTRFGVPVVPLVNIRIAVPGLVGGDDPWREVTSAGCPRSRSGIAMAALPAARAAAVSSGVKSCSGAITAARSSR
jgi:hypothetical protein